MTDEGLLAKIDKVLDFYSEPSRQHNQVVIGGYKALRAVVELHKPIKDGCGDEDCCGPLNYICTECPTHNYPCPTIQATEKGLR